MEGVSFLVLLGVAMPLKYIAGQPLAVTIVGSIHGVLFVLYIAAIAHMKVAMNWPNRRVIGALAASILPFGPFIFDIQLRRDERSADATR